VLVGVGVVVTPLIDIVLLGVGVFVGVGVLVGVGVDEASLQAVPVSIIRV
jgi:hypothetical protein